MEIRGPNYNLIKSLLVLIIAVANTANTTEQSVEYDTIAYKQSDETPEFVNNEELPGAASSQHLLQRSVRSLKDVDFELEPAEGRHKNRRKSYNYKSKPRRNQYNNHNRHSDHKQGKGGYHTSDSYDTNSGYSTNSNYDRATKGDYGDSDHKQYGGKRGDSYGGKGQGGREYGSRSGGSQGYHGGSDGHYRSGGGSSNHNGYGDDSSSYLRGGEY